MQLGRCKKRIVVREVNYMANIIMCSTETCPYRDTCYRYRATPGKQQNYSNFEYKCNKDSGFENYIPIRRDE